MAFEDRDLAERHRVHTGETLESLAAQIETTRAELELFNWGTNDRVKVNEHLRQDVGCTHQDAAGNYVFDDSDEPGIVLLPRKFARDGLPINMLHTVRARPPQEDEMLLTCVSIPGITFAFDSSFIRPTVVDHIQKLDLAVQRYPDAKIIVYGHTDRVGGDQYNKDLSDRRAKSAYAFVTDQPAIWEELYNEERWGLSVVQEILKDLGHDPGTIDGQMGDDTRRAMRSFLGVPDDTPVQNDAAFREKLFLAYMTGNHDAHVDEARFVAPKFMGCGEFNPVVDPNAPEVQNRRPGNEPNRRVTFYFFKRPPQNIPCKLHDLSPCRTEIAKQTPRRNLLNRCAFYDRIAARCPEDETRRRENQPTFFTIEEPGASNHVRMHSLWAYMVHYVGDTNEIEQVQRFRMREGKLCSPADDRPVPVECDRVAWFYFSHRDDLLTLDQARFFARDRSGLPLLGPIQVTCGDPARVNLNIWEQKDWVIVRGPRVFGTRPDGVKMGEWREDYRLGQLLGMQSGGIGFFPHGDHREKARQERWKGLSGTANLVDLIHLGNPRGDPMWAGTLTALPSNKAKLFLMHNFGSGSALHAGSYNEIEVTGDNQDLPGHHCFNQALVRQLLSLPASDQPGPAVDGLPSPPARCLLPGDICWADQGQTNNCGAFSFAAAMNYWEPYTSNPARMDGATYARPGNVDDTINGARTPADIVNAAGRFRMSARDNDAEELNRGRAVKLVKLWIQAGVPVLTLVEEEYNVWSLHWKTVVGYDGNRIFYNNSGADDEVVLARRTPGIDYEHGPLGNDVDSETAFFDKWKSAGGDAVDLITSVDECTFIPIVPRDAMYARNRVL